MAILHINIIYNLQRPPQLLDDSSRMGWLSEGSKDIKSVVSQGHSKVKLFDFYALEIRFAFHVGYSYTALACIAKCLCDTNHKLLE